jgi:uncharacterized RDD family membrane protein YckC
MESHCTSAAQEDLLHIESASVIYEAHKWQRLLNYIIDFFVIDYLFGDIVAEAVVVVLYELSPLWVEGLDDSNLFSIEMLSLGTLVWALIFTPYYTLSEKLFKGYTLGKFITGSRAVRSDGKELTFKDAFLRSVIRIIPLEVFSGLWRPWHDTWTDTMVIKSR